MNLHYSQIYVMEIFLSRKFRFNFENSQKNLFEKNYYSLRRTAKRIRIYATTTKILSNM